MNKKKTYHKLLLKDACSVETLFDKFFKLQAEKSQTGNVRRHSGVNISIKKVVKKLDIVCMHRGNMRRLYAKTKRYNNSANSNIINKEITDIVLINKELAEINEALRQMNEENNI